jgi:hypothetical protein
MPISVTINQRGDWDFTVIEKKVLVPVDDDPAQFTAQSNGASTSFNGIADAVPNHKAILREDTGQVFYIGSDKYQPIPHRTVLAPVITGFSNHHVTTTVKSIDHGAKVFADFIFELPIVIGGEVYRGGIRIVNSLDGTFRLVIEGMLFRERDSSYLVLSETLMSFERRHILGQMANSDFARVAGEAMQRVVSRLASLRDVAGVSITEVAFRQLIDRIDMPKKYKKLACDIWETPDIAEMERSAVGTLGGVLTLLAYLGTHELSRTLNDEAVYRWQKNVDSALNRLLRTVSQSWTTAPVGQNWAGEVMGRPTVVPSSDATTQQVPSEVQSR